MSLAKRFERTRRETVGATLLATARWLRTRASETTHPVSTALREAAEELEGRVMGPPSGDAKEAG